MHPACACAPWFWNGELVGRAQWLLVALRRLTDRTLDLDTLEVLVRVAETVSLTRAADVLGVTQQAVSARLRAAEQAIGQPLAHRTASGTALTDAGRVVLGLAVPVLEASRRLEAGVAALREPAGSLLVAASQTIAELLLPGWLLAHRAIAPDASVRLIAGNSAAVIDLVRSGAADLGFTETPAAPPDLSSLVVDEDELVVVVAPHHPWASASGITADDLAETPLLLREEGPAPAPRSRRGSTVLAPPGRPSGGAGDDGHHPRQRAGGHRARGDESPHRRQRPLRRCPRPGTAARPATDPIAARNLDRPPGARRHGIPR